MAKNDLRVETHSQHAGAGMMTHILRFLADEKGATAIEYALIAGSVSIVILASVLSLGTTVNTMFMNVLTSLR
jgi:pilus assembly protein Flp/PilA